MYSEIKKCRISDSTNLITVLSLGEQVAIADVFSSVAAAGADLQSRVDASNRQRMSALNVLVKPERLHV